MEFFTDVLHINKNITLDTFPMGGPLEDWSQQGYHPMMAIGLGDNSTLLNALKAGNYIASRVWSTFYGWTGGDSNTQLDGTFVFGGYDRAKVSGEGHTQDLIDDARCPTRMLVVIDDIVLHFPNGTDVSIVAEKPNGSFDACIVPDYPVLMTLAYDPYMAAFEYYTNVSLTQRSTGLAYFSLLYNDGDEPYRGDMTIDIRDGPAVRVPNSQLVVPEQYIADPNGQLMANYSRSNLVINSLQDVNANDITQLGRQFLSSAYVMLNQDSGKFTLWSANPTGVEDLVAVDEKGQDATDWCEASTAPTPGAGALDGAGASQVGKSSSNGADAQVSPGAIAGAVVGGVAFLAFVIGGLLLYRRGRAKANAVARSAPSIDTPAYRNTMSYQGGASSYIHKSVSEMGDGNINRGPNELDGVTIDQLSQTARTERRYELG
ncbi:Uu.00g100920.m01.CDS01 [Anthostomella pinea]|uniref:Uu.00g100920.m01.CDS01 n=1 Tax=Anthostomella pinea TaxID=933095 RepID=A0AAI8YFD5_9PEZI|nr:Uu.00g100920.m01.CDS01 [Anthostomella pinea]